MRELLARAGFGHVAFEPAIFSQYDMFLVASRRPIATVDGWREALRRSRSGRMVEALIDAYDEACAARAAGDRERQETQRLQGVIEDIERDRAARLEEILKRDRILAGLSGQAAELERLREVERAYRDVQRRLGPLRRLFGAGRPVRTPEGETK